MSDVTHLNQIVQVKRRRAWGYATVELINKDGSVRKRDKTLVVKFPEDVSHAASAGSLWEISGKEYVNQLNLKDVTIIEYTIEVEKIKYLRPSGRILARWLSSNIPGIGPVIAARLVRLKNLNEAVSARDIDALLQVSGMTKGRAERLFEQWPEEILHQTIEWLEAQQLPLGLGENLVSLFGSDALKRVSEHPFLLMAMGASFEKTIKVAEALGLSSSDESVLAGIALHVVIERSAQTGSTVIAFDELNKGVSKFTNNEFESRAGDMAVSQGLLVKVDSGFQTYGAALMEATVAKFLVDSHKRELGKNSLWAAWELTVNRDVIENAIRDYEKSLGFKMTADQREAVIGAIMSPVSCISGGAGTGKTTILKAVLAVFSSIAGAEVPFFLMALSGRAAQRMALSTGLPAQTIAKFISHAAGKKVSRFPDHALVVIDEASMLDLLSMYKLIGVLGPATRLLFVGDTSQLPPVGSGLVFHQLADTGIPFFNLAQVKRQSELSAIHRFATSIRNSQVEHPSLLSQTLAKSGECVFEPFTSMSYLIDLWREAGGISSSIILCPTKKGELGVDNINKVFQLSAGNDRALISYQDMKRGWIPWITRSGTYLHEGDPVIVMANNYDEDADLRNGDLGIIAEVFEFPDTDGALAMLEVDGSLFRITPQILAKLELGYAITIHKAQGSQWHTCFVVLSPEAEFMMDQTLLYTAVTRPVSRLVLIGDKSLIDKAIARGSMALKRNVFLQKRLMQSLSQSLLASS